MVSFIPAPGKLRPAQYFVTRRCREGAVFLQALNADFHGQKLINILES